jgi:hypothetical protein
MSRARDISNDQANLGGAVAPFVAGKNVVINGGMDIWQRGTSFTIAGHQYAADRFEGSIGGMTAGTLTVSRQTAGLTGFNYALRFQRNAGATTTGSGYFTCSMENENIIPLQGKVVTWSFYARAGANYSMASSQLFGYLQTGTGTNENINNGYTGNTTLVAGTVVLTTSWQRFTFTGTVPSNATEGGFYFQYVPVGTAGAADYYEITGFQLEAGSIATPFSRAGGSIGGELALCQRYYKVLFDGALNASQSIANGMAYNSTGFYGSVIFSTMRTTPSVEQTTGTNYYALEGNAGLQGFFSLNWFTGSPTGLSVNATGTFTQGYSYWVRLNNSLAKVSVSAEL